MVTNSFVIVAGSLKLFRYQYLKDKLIRPVSDKKTSNFSEIVTTDSRHDLEIWNTFRLGDKGAYAGIYEGHFDALYAYCGNLYWMKRRWKMRSRIFLSIGGKGSGIRCTV